MIFTSSRLGLLMGGILLPLAIGGMMLHSAWQQVQTGSPIPPLSSLSAALVCFLMSAFLVYAYSIRANAHATIIRFHVFFVGLLWVVCGGITAESLVGTYLWNRHTAIAGDITTSVYHGSKGKRIYTDVINYRYTFDEKEYVGQEAMRDPDRLVNKPLHGNQRLNIGPVMTDEEIYIRLHPTDPERSFIQRRVRYIPLLLFLLSTFLLGRWVSRGAITEKNLYSS